MTCFLQCSAGLPEQTFLVTYDLASDELRIATNVPFATAPVNLNITYAPGNFIVSNPPDFTQPDPLHFVLPNASGRASGSNVTNITFYDADFNELGQWNGSVSVLGPGYYPILEGIYSPAANTVAFVGQRFQTAWGGAVSHLFVRLASYSTGCLDGPFMGTNVPVGNNGWTVVSFTDTLIELSNPLFTTCTPDDASPDFIVNGISLDAPNYGTPPGDGYYFYEPWGSPSPYSAVIDGTTPLPP